jgi:hypothetical protein
MHRRIDAIEESVVNGRYRKFGRPARAARRRHDSASERKDAIAHCHDGRALTVPKVDGNAASYTVQPVGIVGFIRLRRAGGLLWSKSRSDAASKRLGQNPKLVERELA